MDDKSRTGVLAALIVGGGVSLAGIGLFAVPAVTNPTDAPGRVTITVPVAQPPDAEDLLAKITRHPFWRVNVSRAMVQEFEAFAASSKRDSTIYLNDRFQFDRMDDTTGHRQITVTATRHLAIDMRRFQTQPSRGQLLDVLLAELDKADFRQPN